MAPSAPPISIYCCSPARGRSIRLRFRKTMPLERRSATSIRYIRVRREEAASSTALCKRTFPTRMLVSSSVRRWRVCMVEAVLLLRRPKMALGDRRATPPKSRQSIKRDLAPPEQRRHHRDAGQMGVSLVRRVGSGISLRDVRIDRPRFRQVPTRLFADPQIVHASNGQLPATSGHSAT